MSKKQPEYELQVKVCRWISETYPELLFMSDTIASVKLTLPQGARNKAIQKAGFKTPDLIIFEPNKYFNGLFIELKTKSPYKKTGGLRKCEHLEAQEKTMSDLRLKNYYAEFSWTFEGTIKIIEEYLSYDK